MGKLLIELDNHIELLVGNDSLALLLNFLAVIVHNNAFTFSCNIQGHILISDHQEPLNNVLLLLERDLLNLHFERNVLSVELGDPGLEHV